MGVFGQRLKELREAAGLTQAVLAMQTGTSGGFISAVENGQKRPSHVTVEAMARALQCDPKELHELVVQDTLEAEAQRKQARQPVAFVLTPTTMPAPIAALVEALMADSQLLTAVLNLQKAMSVLSEQQRKALLTFIEDFVPKED